MWSVNCVNHIAFIKSSPLYGVGGFIPFFCAQIILNRKCPIWEHAKKTMKTMGKHCGYQEILDWYIGVGDRWLYAGSSRYTFQQIGNRVMPYPSQNLTAKSKVGRREGKERQTDSTGKATEYPGKQDRAFAFAKALSCSLSRGRRIRTLNKGFGDPRVTITPCP